MQNFETAARAVVDGDLAELRRLLALGPDLVHRRTADPDRLDAKLGQCPREIATARCHEAFLRHLDR